MRILLIGGTIFLGKNIVEAALAAGHEVTLFNRGKTNPELFPEIEKVRGDRLEGFKPIEGREFDCVIDTCAYFPRAVKISRTAFPNAHYVFISTISVYSELDKVGLKDGDAVGTLEDPTTEVITGGSYGPLKALCENVVRDSGGSFTIIRPGLIIGPDDPTDRFTYWPVRMAEAGEGSVLVPDVNQPVQVIDVRDLATWTVSTSEAKTQGVYNATGPQIPLTLDSALDQIRSAVNPRAQLSKVSAEILTAEKVEPWSDLPLILPYDGSSNGMLSVDTSNSISARLQTRPLGETALDTLKWWQSKGSPALKIGLTRQRELAILEA
ncbi:MAG TPA: hypothetical protein VGL56_00335 [Fimbriimonadaceae bacterium]|jgi:2'-hydroxyisoflavone reductase